MDINNFSLFYITDFWFPKMGGMERSIDNLCRTLPEYLSLSLLTGKGDNEGEKDFQFPYDIQRFPVEKDTGYYTYALDRIRKSGTPRIIHFFGFSFFWPAAQADLIESLSNLPETRLVFKIPTLGDPTRYLKTSHLKVMGLINKFIALNISIAGELINCGIDEKNISLIPNGVLTSVFKPVSRERKKQFREKLNLPIKNILLGFCGRFEHRKRIDLLISAIKDIPVGIRPILVLMGYADSTFGTGFETDGLPLGDVVLLPASPDTRPFYLAIDGYLSASEQEGMSNAILEAISCGLPVIASDIPGHRELVKHGENGLLFEKGNKDQLVDCINKLCLQINTSDFEKWGKSSRSIALRNYNSVDIAAKYLDLYNNLLAF